MTSNRFGRAFVGWLAASLAATAVAAVPVPAPGASPRIDAIKKAGVLRVGVLANAPWLVENTTGTGDAWSGPAWLLANEYAKRLGVKLRGGSGEPRDQGAGARVEPGRHLGHAARRNARSARRSSTSSSIRAPASACSGSRPIRSSPTRNRSTISTSPRSRSRITPAAARKAGSRSAFPKAQLRGVAGSGVAPVEEVMAKRADAVPINRVPWVAMGRKLKQLAVLPKDNNCQNSTEKAAPVGMAIDKNQPAFLQWARAVEKEIEPQAQDGRGARRRYDEVAAGAHSAARVARPPGRRPAWISISPSSPTTGASSRRGVG